MAGTSLQFSDKVKLFGVKLDQALTVDRHVSSIVISCNFHMQALCHIRLRLTLDAAKSVTVTSIVGARLDHCNSLLYGTPQRNLDRLQRVQNSLARVVTQAPHRTSATELRRQLHWLSIANASSSNLAPSGLSTLVSPAIWRMKCTVINRRYYLFALTSHFLGLSQTDIFRSLGSGCLEQHPCCCS